MKLGGRFKLQDLPREEGQGSLADLAGYPSDIGIYVEADFPVSIHNAENPVASYVLYRIMSPLGETTPE